MLAAIPPLLLGSDGLWIALALIGGFAAYSAVQLLRNHRARKVYEKEIFASLAYSQAAPWFDRVLQPRLPFPSSVAWALRPETAAYLVRHVLHNRPEVVVEVGSGVSTLFLAYALERSGGGKVVSVDAEEWYVERTRGLLEMHGLAHRAEIHYAPLQPFRINGWSGPWYDPSPFHSLVHESVDLLVVDGPPELTSSLARYPALPVLSDYLKPDAVVLLDDADREDETEVLRRWRSLGWGVETLPVPKGGAVLRRR